MLEYIQREDDEEEEKSYLQRKNSPLPPTQNDMAKK